MSIATKTAAAITATLALPLALSAFVPTGLVIATSLALPFIALGHLEGALAS